MGKADTLEHLQITENGRRLQTKRRKKCKTKDQRTAPEEDRHRPSISSLALMSLLLPMDFRLGSDHPVGAAQFRIASLMSAGQWDFDFICDCALIIDVCCLYIFVLCANKHQVRQRSRVARSSAARRRQPHRPRIRAQSVFNVDDSGEEAQQLAGAGSALDPVRLDLDLDEEEAPRRRSSTEQGGVVHVVEVSQGRPCLPR